MKILAELIEKAEDTLEEVEFYGRQAQHLKVTDKSVADLYNKLATTHIEIYGNIHREIVNLIEEHKRTGHQPPPEMLAIWNYEHKKLIERFTKAKNIVNEY
jgi:DNA polymerase/3'-5' exonuclease PolX